MDTPEKNLNKTESNEPAVVVPETKEHEVTKEEVISFAEGEKVAFVVETAAEIQSLNSVGLDNADFEKLKQESGIEGDLKEINAEAERAVEDAKNEAFGETKETQNPDGIDFIFEQNPELKTIGTKEQYKQYIESVFPESQVKDILYHYSSHDKIKEEGFKFFTELEAAAGAGEIEAIWFTKKATNYWGDNDLNKYAAVINSAKPLDIRAAVTENDPAIQEYNRVWEIGTNKEYDPWDITKPIEKKFELQKNRKLAFKEAGYDSVLTPNLEEVAVFDKENIHILGSGADVQRFKEFVSGDKK